MKRRALLVSAVIATTAGTAGAGPYPLLRIDRPRTLPAGAVQVVSG
jgi:hypothetical protein